MFHREYFHFSRKKSFTTLLRSIYFKKVAEQINVARNGKDALNSNFWGYFCFLELRSYNWGGGGGNFSRS